MVSIATLKLACELAGVWMAGMAAILAFVVATVDRLNARIAELETKLEAAQGGGRDSRGGTTR
jgi:hypothetical protein